MTPHIAQPLRELVSAPLRIPLGVERIGRGLWLYLQLVALANRSGRICRTLDALGKDLGIEASAVSRWLDRLQESQLVEVESPAPYLVIRLRFWSGMEDRHGESGPAVSDQRHAVHEVVPVGSSKQQPAASASSKLEDGGAGEGGSLLAEVLRVLGESDADEFQALLSEFPTTVILKALVRVKTTPESQIRKSKAALFRFLLAKFAKERHAHA